MMNYIIIMAKSQILDIKSKLWHVKVAIMKENVKTMRKIWK